MSKKKNHSYSEPFFDSLARNAIDFIEKSIEELDHSPKYSVIHFYTAIELFIKARLLVEHWSLIVSKPELANLTKFKAGDFQSVNMWEAVKRLKGISSEKIGDKAEVIFDVIGKHRNKLVHFFHEKYLTTPDNITLEEIIPEQYTGWYHLHFLITNKWRNVFKDYQDEIERLNQLMHRQKEFLSVKFDELKDDIGKDIQAGVNYTTCIYCNFLAAKIDDSNDPIFSCKCRICHMRHNYLLIECPKCNSEVKIEDLGVGECKKCGFKSDLDYLLLKLGPHEDPREESDKAYCANCSYTNEPTVIPIYSKYLCLNCLELFDETERCDWCNELLAGMDLTDSYYKGCVLCDGHGYRND
jgi:hypothetical protein